MLIARAPVSPRCTEDHHRTSQCPSSTSLPLSLLSVPQPSSPCGSETPIRVVHKDLFTLSPLSMPLYRVAAPLPPLSAPPAVFSPYAHFASPCNGKAPSMRSTTVPAKRCRPVMHLSTCTKGPRRIPIYQAPSVFIARQLGNATFLSRSTCLSCVKRQSIACQREGGLRTTRRPADPSGSSHYKKVSSRGPTRSTAAERATLSGGHRPTEWPHGRRVIVA